MNRLAWVGLFTMGGYALLVASLACACQVIPSTWIRVGAELALAGVTALVIGATIWKAK